MTPVHRIHPKTSDKTEEYKMCTPRDTSLGYYLSRPKFFDREFATRRMTYTLFVLLVISACVVIFPRDDNVHKIVNNNLRGVDAVVSGARAADPITEVNDSILKPIDISDADHGMDSQRIDSGTLQHLLISDKSDRVPLRQIDPKRFHRVDNPIDVGEPFYTRWPESGLPEFALKAVNYNVPREESVCFVHVGKTAGSTVGCYLGFSHHCDNTTELEGVLPMITTHLFHNDVDNCYDDAAYYLFVLRDPVDRAKSAFYYNRPDEDCSDINWKIYEQYYTNCSFWTFEGELNVVPCLLFVSQIHGFT